MYKFQKGHKGDILWGEFCLIFLLFFDGLFCVWRFRGGGKGSDEEHITYSGGKEIFDLLQCG